MTDIDMVMIISRVSLHVLRVLELTRLWLSYRDEIFILLDETVRRRSSENYNGADRFSHLSINLIDTDVPVTNSRFNHVQPVILS